MFVFIYILFFAVYNSMQSSTDCISQPRDGHEKVSVVLVLLVVFVEQPFENATAAFLTRD